MSKIMMEMIEEMAPMFGMPTSMSPEMMMKFKEKMALGIAPGEVEGSLHDLMMQMMPGMKMMPGAKEPGQTPTKMVEAMLKGWREKHGAMPDVPRLDMHVEPTLSPVLVA